jgi:hypothetical protein
VSIKVGDVVIVLPGIAGYYGPINKPLTVSYITGTKVLSYDFEETAQVAWAPFVVPLTSLLRELC